MGFGSYSATFSYVPRDVPAKPPTAPRNLPLQTNRVAVFVEFDALKSEYQGGSVILSFNLYIDDGHDGNFAGPFSVAPTESTWDTQALGLTMGLIYKIKYSATNIHGEGMLSEEVSILMAEKPSAPTSFTRVDKTTLPAGQIRVTWALPSDEGGTPVTGYRIYLQGLLHYDSRMDSTLNSFVFINLTVG